MLKIIIEVSGSDYSPENDGHEPSPLNACHRFEFSVADDPLNGPTLDRQLITANKIAELVRMKLVQ